ncbi:MAG: tetratricopeptide repeat protein [bacterium]|nr:tetratricopeptide repeat protein [bacterium]
MNPRRMLYPLAILALAATGILTLLGLADTAPLIAHAAPLPQTITVTLSIINESEETICFVVVCPPDAQDESDCFIMNDEAILPGKTRAFDIAAGNYVVSLADCDENVLLIKPGFAIADQHELRYAPAPKAETLSIINESEEIICLVLVCSPGAKDESDCFTLMNDEAISPGETRAFDIAAGDYDVGLVDCDENVLLIEQGITIADQQELRYAPEAETLSIINESEETICLVLVCSPGSKDESDCFSLMNDEAISPGETHAFDIAAGDYDVGLFDCDGNVLLIEQGITIADQQELRYAPAPEADSLCDTLWRSGNTLLGQANYQEALQEYTEALTCYQEADDRQGESRALFNMGVAYDDLEQYTTTIEYCEQALDIARDIGDRYMEGRSLDYLGNAYNGLEQYETAIEYYEQALDIARDMGDREMEGVSLGSLGNAYLSMGQYETAIEYCEQALDIARDIGDQYMQGANLVNLGAAYHNLGQYATAIEYSEQALDIARNIGDQNTERGALNNLGNAYHGLAQYVTAIKYYEQALDIARNIGSRQGEGQTLANLGGTYSSMGQYVTAVEHSEQALTIARDIGDWNTEENALSNLGIVYHHLGQYATAIEYYEQALDIARDIGDRNMEGSVLNNLGVVYYSMGQYTTAIEYHEQALTIARDIGDRNMEGSTLGNLGNAYSGLGQYATAIEYHEQSLTIARDIGDRNTEGLALNNLGNTYSSTGQYATAIEYYEQALTIARDIDAQYAKGISLGNLGNVYYLMGQYATAIEYSEQALTIARDIGNRNTEGNVLDHLGNAYSAMGQYATAIEYHEQALTIARDIGDRNTEGSALGNLGSVYSAMGQYATAIEYYEQTLDIVRNIGSRYAEGVSLNNLGSVYFLMGQYATAIEYHEQALTITRDIGDRNTEGGILGNLGDVYSFMGQYTMAIEYHEQAMNIARDIGARNAEGGALGRLGSTYIELGQYTTAIGYLEQALDIARDISDRQGEGSNLGNLGNVYFLMGQYTTTIEYCEHGLTIARDIGDRNNEGRALGSLGNAYFSMGQYTTTIEHSGQALDIARDIGDRNAEGRALGSLGSGYLLMGQYTTTIEYYEQSLGIARDISDRNAEGRVLSGLGIIYSFLEQYSMAIEYLEQAIAVIETMRGELRVEEFKISFAAKYIFPYHGIIPLLVEMERPADAFHYAQRAKARAFLDQLGNARVAPRTGADPELVAQEQDLVDQISALQRAISQGGDVDYAALAAQLESLQTAYNQVLIDLKRSNPAYASLVSIDPLSIDEIRATVLDERTSLIAYFVTGEKSIAFVLDQETLVAVSLPISRTRLAAQVERFHGLINVEPHGGPTQARERTELAQDLHRSLIAPVLPHVEHARLIVIPHDVLHTLPFAALLDQGQHPLAARFTLSTAPSISSLAPEILNRNENGGQLLALGNPSTAASPLPHAEAEAIAVAGLYPRSTLFTGAQASEAALRGNVEGADVIHLATHGTLDPVNPLFSTLLLAGEETDAANDGQLQVREVFDLDLSDANLVVLSACETALGEQSQGDELVGLSRAFMYAGTPVVVASLWPVEDAATGALMLAFHRRVQDGQGAAAALAQAQAEIRDQDAWAAPYYWAGFVVIGDGGSQAARSLPTVSWAAWIAGVILAAVVGAIVWRRWRLVQSSFSMNFSSPDRV